MGYEYDRRLAADKNTTAVSFIETAISQLQSIIKHLKANRTDFNAALGVRHAIETLEVAEKEVSAAPPKKKK
jgi:hypothetical protein